MDINGHTPLCEDYVSFETAKLLKEKGFDLHNANELYIEYKDGYCVINNPYTKHYCTDEFPKATLQMALKWLRYEKNIHIKVHCSGHRNYLVYAQSLVAAFPDFCIKSETCSFNTYEEAVEAAIKYCLTTLI